MLKTFACIAALLFCVPAFSAELFLDFSKMPQDTKPAGFTSKVSGVGEPGHWRVIEDEIPSIFEPLSSNAPKIGKRPVVAQLSQDKADEHFPLLVYEGEHFGDFKLTTRFKCVSGVVEQMAGIAFRIQDEKNYYIVRASALGNSFRFYKFVNGERSAPIGPSVEIPSGVWHEMSIQCKGNEIRCWLNGKELIPALTDNSFSAGKIGYWTKSDSVSYFADTRIDYTPRVPMAQRVITKMMGEFPRLIGLKVFARNHAGELRVVASNNEAERGEPGKQVEADVIATETPHYAKSKETVSVIMPLRDRNGVTVAALRVILKPFPGQTEKNALARALPIAKAVEAQLISVRDISQ